MNGIASYTLANSSREGFEGDDYSAEDVYVVETDSGNELKAYGGYYTYNAATAGTGVSIGPDEDATSSICPKGWRDARGANVAATRRKNVAGSLGSEQGVICDKILISFTLV